MHQREPAPAALREQVRAGVLAPVCRGGYADAALLAGADPEQAHRLRLKAVLGAAALCTSVGVQGVVDAALRSGVVTRADLETGMTTWGRRHGGSMLRHAIAHADPSAESLGESGLRMLLMALGYRVRCQVVIRDGGDFVARVDFYLPDLGVVRVIWSDLAHPDQVLARIERATRQRSRT